MMDGGIFFWIAKNNLFRLTKPILMVLGILGYVLSSKIDIEQFLGQLKAIIIKIYYIIPTNGYIYFISEIEFRYSITRYDITNQVKFL